MRAKQAEGSPNKKKKHGAKDFNAVYENSMHQSVEGWYGFPASCIRNALISACRVAGFVMTRAKLSIFVLADGYGSDGIPLLKFTKGEPKHVEHVVTLANGSPDITARGMWDAGWEVVLRIKYDGDQFQLDDVANLLMRAGIQVGIGSGRPDSKTSCGMGWGTFEIKG
jgi:hypothetical protein